MSQRPMPSNYDGKINLEQQRKRAKELLKRLKAGAAPDQMSLIHSPSPTLSDAQWLVAKELGFSSWPKLKAHVDAVDFRARNPGFEASDEAQTTHWRCGNDIAHSLQLAGFKGAFQMLTDPLCMGAVQDLPMDQYKAARGVYISEAFGIKKADVLQRLDTEYAALDLLESDQHNVLWCEADAYDQLFLIRALAGLKRLPARLELIQVNSIPGVQRFIGIGQLAPDLLAWLWPQRSRVSEQAIELARRAWRAYCDSSPVELAEIARGTHPSLPLLAPALRRQLQELPGVQGGLSLTERLSLQYLEEAGSVAFGRVFGELMGKREPLPFLGDMMFYAMMRPLIDSTAPLLEETDTQLDWPKRTLKITQLGREVLNGTAYWPDHAQHERWVGGVRIRPRSPHWTIEKNNDLVWRSDAVIAGQAEAP